MALLHFFPRWFLLGILVLTSSLVQGQRYPNKPKHVITGAPGGGIDFTARIVAQGLTTTLGQQAIVDNRGGGGGIMAGEITASASPDGYTVMVYSANIWLSPFLQDNVSFDPVREVAPISLVSSAPNTWVVHPSLPVTTIKELM